MQFVKPSKRNCSVVTVNAHDALTDRAQRLSFGASSDNIPLFVSNMNRIKAFLRGIREFRCNATTHYSKYINAYDCGREFAHRMTLRKFEP